MQQKNNNEADIFPISKLNSIQGTRRLVREKVLQILVAHYVSTASINELFEHIFFRDFYLEENEIEAEKQKQKEYLTKEEIVDLLADAKIKWRDEDIIFGKKLLNECEKYFEFITTIIKNVSENWDYDRINIIDKTIIIICCSEMIGFSDIPVRATINEAVELAKKFSTDKSFIFVNAVVEKIKKHLMDENLIQKSERGSK